MKKFSFGLIGLLAIPFVSGCFSNGNSDIKDFRDFIVPLYSLTDSNTTSHIENLKVKDVVFKIANASFILFTFTKALDNCLRY